MNPTDSTHEGATTARPKDSSLRLQIIIFTLARLILTIGYRMVYPFLPEIAEGLRVEKSAVANAVTARSALGLVSPVFGMLADNAGRRVALITGLGLFTVGVGVVVVWPTYPVLFASLMLVGAAKLVFDPAMQSYLGDRVPYARRGRVLAITELSWSLAFLLGVPVVGWWIGRTGRWQSPFPWLLILGALAIVALWRLIPADRPAPADRPSLTQGMRVIAQHPAALAGLAVGLLISMSNETVNIVYGTWLDEGYGLQVAALGLTAGVIGVAELGAEGLVAGVVDRLGKRRAIVLGLAGNAAASLLLPLLDFGVGSALVGLFLFFVTFEFALVSLIPLMTELAPGARATLMAGNIAAISAGRMLGAQLGFPLFEIGLGASAAAAASMDVIAIALLVLLIHQE